MRGLLREEHGGTGTNTQKMERLRAWVSEQRAIAESYGHAEIILTLGAIAPQYSHGFIDIGFDAATNPVTHAKYTWRAAPHRQTRKGTREGTIIAADYETQLMPSMQAHWDAMYAIFERLLPTVTQRRLAPLASTSAHVSLPQWQPGLYAKALEQAKNSVLKHGGRKFITVGIWNEFYEGAYLEPDLKYGFEYLAPFNRSLKNNDSLR